MCAHFNYSKDRHNRTTFLPSILLFLFLSSLSFFPIVDSEASDEFVESGVTQQPNVVLNDTNRPEESPSRMTLWQPYSEYRVGNSQKTLKTNTNSKFSVRTQRRNENNKSRHSSERRRVTAADLNLRWNNAKNTWESISDSDVNPDTSVTASTVNSASRQSNTNNKRVRIPHLTVDIINSPNKEGYHVDTSQRQDATPGGDARSTIAPQEVTRRFAAVAPYTAKFIRGINVQTTRVKNTSKNNFPHENTVSEDTLRIPSTRRETSRKSHVNRLNSQAADRRRRRLLKSNVARESRQGVARNRYLARRRARLQSNLASSQILSKDLSNPFDRLTQNSIASSNGNVRNSSNNRVFGINSEYASSNHYSFNLNTTLSVPHYYRALHDMNKPITPYNWRKNRNNLRKVNNNPKRKVYNQNSGVKSTIISVSDYRNTNTEGLDNSSTGVSSPDRNTRSFTNSSSRAPGNRTTYNATPYTTTNVTPSYPHQQQSPPPSSLPLTSSHRYRYPNVNYNNRRYSEGGNTTSKPSRRRRKRPNILLIMTDDLDVELGSLKYMPRLRSLLQEEGGVFPHSYTSTPMCCPSRSSMLTGMYIHNHEVYTNNDNCSSVKWQETHEQRTFATYLSDAGYNTGYFGKYLNKYKGPHTPPGWRDWMGLRLNSRYYNYTVFKNGEKIKYGDSYPRDYFPHVITKEGLRFLRDHVTKNTPEDPFMMVLSYPAPHGPEDSAPEYNKLFMNATDHHTVAYDYAPNPDKQWILQYTSRMSPIQLKFTNMLMTKRLQTLQSVDDAIERVISELRQLNELDNTYIFFTSDHGYHLGQFGLTKGKSMNFEFDVKIPFLVRGPGVVKNKRYNEITLNVDLAPTFLDIGGVKPPPHMDGRSLLPILKGEEAEVKWRQSFLIESSGRYRDEEVFEMKAQRRYKQLNRLLNLESKLNSTLSENNSIFSYPVSTNDNAADTNSTTGDSDAPSSQSVGELPLYTSKHEHLEVVCQNEELQTPCSPFKKWRCQHDGYRWRLKKCRDRVSTGGGGRRGNCMCGPEMGMGYLVRLDQEERRRQKTFLKQHVNSNLRRWSPKFLKAFVDVDSGEVAKENIRFRNERRRQNRVTRSVNEQETAFSIQNPNNNDDEEQGITHDDVLDESNSNHGANVHAYVEEEELKDIERQIHNIYDELHHLEAASSKTPHSRDGAVTQTNNVTIQEVAGGCIAVGGSVVDCPSEVYNDRGAWKSSKHAIDEEIRRLSHQMRVLKSIRQHLRVSRPRLTLGGGKKRRRKGGQSGIEEEVSVNEEEFQGNNINVQDSELTNLYDELYPELHNSNGTFGSDSTESNSITGSGSGGTIIDGYDYSINSDDNSTSDPDHFSYTGGYHRNKGGTRVYSPSTDSNTVCWCNKRAALQQLNKEQKIERLMERKKQRQLRIQLRQSRRKQRKKNHKEKPCNLSHQNCYHHDNDHWKTPPLWTDGSFCSCLNSANNTYWCVRSINETHNTLYCEFITGLITYYDLNIDPYQLRNVAFMLDNAEVAELHNMLTLLRSCKGADECDLFDKESNKDDSLVDDVSNNDGDSNDSTTIDAYEVNNNLVNRLSNRNEGYILNRRDKVVNNWYEQKSEDNNLLSNEVTDLNGNSLESYKETNGGMIRNRNTRNKRLKKEQKRRRKLMRRLRKDQKKRRLNNLLYSSPSSLNDVKRVPRKSRQQRLKARRDKRRRRLERKLEQIKQRQEGEEFEELQGDDY